MVEIYRVNDDKTSQVTVLAPKTMRNNNKTTRISMQSQVSSTNDKESRMAKINALVHSVMSNMSIKDNSYRDDPRQVKSSRSQSSEPKSLERQLKAIVKLRVGKENQTKQFKCTALTADIEQPLFRPPSV